VYELPAIERYIGKKIPSEIAMAELFAEDKSAGQRINTEFALSPHEDRRPARPSRKAAPGRAQAGNRAPAAGHHGAAGGRARIAPPHSTPAVAKHRHDKHKSAIPLVDALISGEKDLSQMTFEERMDLYKMKYHGGGRGVFNVRQQKNKRRGGKPDAAQKPANPQPQQQRQPEQNAPPPKNFLSRLLGIFKK